MKFDEISFPLYIDKKEPEIIRDSKHNIFLKLPSNYGDIAFDIMSFFNLRKEWIDVERISMIDSIDKEQVLRDEYKYHLLGYKSYNDFKLKEGKDLVPCKSCGVYYWKDCHPNCDCELS